MKQEVLENHRKYQERIDLYKSFGYDIQKEREFIVEKSHPIYGKILEIGTGKGYLAIELAMQKQHLISIDISEIEQNMAKLNAEFFGVQEYIKFQVENAESLSFFDKSFDIIFSVNVLHHLLNPFKVMDEILRIMTSSGKIILADFTQRGFDLIDEILATEGRKHEVGVVKLPDVYSYFAQKGLHIKKYQTEIQEVLVISYCGEINGVK